MTEQNDFQVMPPLTDAEFDALKEDIRLRGVLVPVDYDEDGNVLDGHHRVRACEELGIKEWPKQRRYGWNDVQKRNHARSLNLARRHMTKKDREPIWAAMRADGMSYRQIADADGTVSHVTVREGVKNLTPDEKPKNVKGKDGKTYPAAKPKRTRYEPIPSDEGEIVNVAKEITAKKKKSKRKTKTENMEKKAGAFPADRFPVLYIDPPWRYDFSETDARKVENQYRTMPVEEIAAMDIQSLATDDALLFMWATAPKLLEALHVMEAWGFTYKTHAVWDKGKIGMGYYFRGQHELLLVGKKGDFPAPIEGTQHSSVIREKRGKHSQKPDLAYLIIERMYPQFQKVELFARKTRDGWASWGDEL